MPSSVDVQGPPVNAHVEILLVEEESFLTTRVEDVRDGGLVVAAPDGDHGVPVFPEPGTRVTVFWVLDNDPLSLPGSVVSTDRATIPTWNVRVEGAPSRGQRRRYVRVPTFVPVRIQRRSQDDPMDASLVDISEGGARCTAPVAFQIAEGEALHLLFTLNDQGFKAKAMVVRNVPANPQARELALSFLDISADDAAAIRRFAFAEQRRLRSLGLA